MNFASPSVTDGGSSFQPQKRIMTQHLIASGEASNWAVDVASQSMRKRTSLRRLAEIAQAVKERDDPEYCADKGETPKAVDVRKPKGVGNLLGLG